MEKEIKNILNKSTLLIVDDDQKIRSIFKKTLNNYFDTILEASDGNSGLDIYHKHKPSVVFTDIKMPLMDGVMFTTILRQLDRTIPIVAISGYSDSEDLLNLVSLNLTDYLIKPVDFDTLQSSLNKCALKLQEFGKIEIKLCETSSYIYSRKVIHKEQKDIDLTPNEIALIELLIENEKQLVTIEQIEDRIYKNEAVTINAINTLVSKLRKKIGENIIKSIPSHGYIMVKKL